MTIAVQTWYKLDMAHTRAMKCDELQSFFIKQHLSKPLEEVVTAVKQGATLEMQESSFSDAGSDFCRVLLNGQEIAYIAGF